MGHSPGRVVQSRLAAFPDGQLAEAARWHDGSTWTPWAAVAAGAIDVAITAAVVDGAPAALVIATPGVGHPVRGRGIHKLAPDGTVAATSL